jgi:hypothetical protein
VGGAEASGFERFDEAGGHDLAPGRRGI